MSLALSCLTCVPARLEQLFGSDRSEDTGQSTTYGNSRSKITRSLLHCSGHGGIGLYCATKNTVRCISETLHQEISPLGLRSVIFEPGYFRTDFLTADNRANYSGGIPDYEPIVRASNEALDGSPSYQPMMGSDS